MKKRLLVSFLSLVLILALLPASALAEDTPLEPADPVACTQAEGCPATDHEAGCPAAATDDETETDGADTDTDGADDPQPTAEEQLAALIAALPDPAGLPDLTEEALEDVQARIAEVEDFAATNGLTLTDEQNAALTAVFTALAALSTQDDAALLDKPFDGTLDISNGSIVITETGYKQGEATDEIAYTGSYTITGTYTLNDTATASSNQVKITAGSTPIQVALQDLTIRHHNARNSTQYASGICSPIQVLGGEVVMTLEGSSTLIADGNNSALFIASSAKLTIKGSGSGGSLMCAGGHRAAGIGACYSSSDANSCKAGSLVIESGRLTVQSGNDSAAIGGSLSSGMESVAISGGYVSVSGGHNSYSIGKGSGNAATLGSLSITGGTISFEKGLSSCKNNVAASSATITGGSFINESGTLPGLDNAKKAALYCGEKNATVTVTVGSATWSAVTDSNGYIYALLTAAPGSSTVSVKLGSGTAVDVYPGYSADLANECTCGTAGTIALNVPEVVYIFNNTDSTDSISYTLSATYAPAEDCTAKHHGAYEGFTFVENSDNAEITNGVLTVHEAQSDYTVSIQIKSLDGKVADTKDISVRASTTEKGFSLAGGSITVEADGDNIKYTQGSNSLTVGKDDKVVVTGSSDTSKLTVKSGDPTIILRDVSLTGSTSPIVIGGSGETTLWLEGTNTVTNTCTNGGTNANMSDNGYAIQVKAGATLTIQSEADNSGAGTAENVFGSFSFEEKMEADGVTDPSPASYEGTLIVNSTYGGIGIVNHTAETTINIKSGNVLVRTNQKNDSYGGIVSAIGGYNFDPSTGSPDSKLNTLEPIHVNISGGNVLAEVNYNRGFSIGGYQAHVNITGGCVAAVNTSSGTSRHDRGAGIGGPNSTVVIGTKDDNSATPYVYAVGKESYPGIGGDKASVTIHSGTVYAQADKNAAAIGAGIGGNSTAITISGGTVAAINTETAHGASIGSRAHTDHYTNGIPFPAKVTISGDATVTAAGILGGGPYFEDDDTKNSSVTISDGASVTLQAGNVYGNVSVSDATFTTVSGVFVDGDDVVSLGNVTGHVTADSSSHVLIDGTVGSAEAAHVVTFVDGETTLSAVALAGSYTKNYTLPAAPEPPSGYTFGGWRSSVDNSVTAPSTPVTIGSDTTFTAVWYSNSSPTTYAVTVSDAAHGSVTASPTRAAYNRTVTITVKPDEGYALSSLSVTDRNGSEVALTDAGDGKYTFTMPRSRVTIEATFAEIEEEPDLFFVDVPTSAYYYDAVYWAAENGVTYGTSATTFSPDVIVSRAQMVTFLWRAHGSPEPQSSVNPFTDVSSSAYYYDAVLWAVENGVTNGTSATTFSPDATVTRAQAVTFQWRAAGSPAVSGGSFADVADSAYYADAVAWAVANGVTNGTGGNNFSPDVGVSRAQAVTFLWRQLA